MRKFTSLAVCLLAACGNDSGGPAVITVSDPVVPAGESGDIVITLHRAGGGDGAVTIPFSTKDETAVVEGDYVAGTGSVHWDDGDMEDKTINVSLVDDLVIEPSESMMIELGKPENASVDKSSFEVTIADDDHPGDSYAVTSAGRLVHFDRADPGRLSWAVDLSGLGANEQIVALDMRPADGKLYALTNQAKLYTVDPMTGAASFKTALVADATDATSPFTALSGSEFGIDFNPVIDRLRLTSNTGQNLRINVDTGAVITDTAISGLASGYTAIAHNNSISAACRTTLYAIDVVSNRFLTQDGNTGTTQGVGGVGFDATASGGFDVYTDEAGKSAGFAILTNGGQSGMYTVDLGSGEATLAREKVGPLAEGETVKSFAISPLPATTEATQQPGELYGVTATDVVSFTRDNPEKLCTSKPIVGLETGETVLTTDMRPSTGILYVLTKIGTAGKLHRIDPASGTMSPAIPVSIALQGSTWGMDFSPTGAVPLRIVSNSGQNIRVNDPNAGAASADSALNGAATSATEAAYTDSVLGAGASTLYVLDPATDTLRIQAGNTGTLTDVGPLGVDLADVTGFDIDGRDNVAFVASTVGNSSQLYTINLATGALSAPLGTIGTSSPLRGLTRATPQTNLYGATTDGKLVRISVTDPATVTNVVDTDPMHPTTGLSGLAGGEYLVGIDFKPGANVMYGVTNTGAVYTVNSSTARANKQGALSADPMDSSSPFTSLQGTAFDVDFEPTGVVPMRLVSDSGQNLRVPDVGKPKCFTDAVLSSASPVSVTATAYTNSFGGATSTMLYAIDSSSGQLMMAGAPNSGALSAVGSLGAAGMWTGFDIAGGANGVAFAALQKAGENFTHLYRVDLATGAATEIGTGIGGTPIRSLAVQIR